ncbi:hypothetical protein [Sediminibacterium sp. TEGAF015]|uniref:hypothetical protein n=1 Tax=Sediminibacterium sp. TEGAF015 TaxID=575378 RepID=UPI0021FD712E|nr:hypothetical protein [Sediminibacterium sp. TEGAF015]BDQ12118.1 hypothetical protein TEGAF0_13350 [Sediminibacterium sp. TEGAF015]
MYYAIYENGGKTRETESKREIFSSLGKYNVYSVLNGEIKFLPNFNKSMPLIINDFVITKFNKRLLKSEIEIFDKKSEKYFDIITRGGELSIVLQSLTNDLNLARKFPTFDTFLEYETLKQEVKSVKMENEKLKLKIQELTKINKKS